jgi:hypothetical protein
MHKSIEEWKAWTLPILNQLPKVKVINRQVIGRPHDPWNPLGGHPTCGCKIQIEGTVEELRIIRKWDEKQTRRRLVAEALRRSALFPKSCSDSLTKEIN